MKSLIALFLLLTVLPLGAQPEMPPKVDLEASLKKARVNGKYAMLLAQIEVPGDQAQYGVFKDYGYSASAEWHEFKNLPAGYWVYVAPFWYIWRDMAQLKRNWGPEQVVGEPDTLEAGDIPTAWASKTQDGQEEWLLLEFPTPVNAARVRVYETYNPGAISKISAFTLDGKEEIVWQGQAAPANVPGVVMNEKLLPRPLKTNRVKLYIDSPRVAGWNEIDAVGLVDAAGKIEWASNAHASTTYAEPQVVPNGVEPPGLVPPGQRLQQLEQTVQQLQNDVNAIKQRLNMPQNAPAPNALAPDVPAPNPPAPNPPALRGFDR